LRRTLHQPSWFAVMGDRQNIPKGLPELYLTFKRAGASAELHVYPGRTRALASVTPNKSPAGFVAGAIREWLRTGNSCLQILDLIC